MLTSSAVAPCWTQHSLSLEHKVHVCLKYRQSKNLHGHTKLDRFFSKVGVEKTKIGGNCDRLKLECFLNMEYCILWSNKFI